MRYLIDGHNLIAQLPDIDLADPDDEAKLVVKLRSLAARTGKKFTVIFDSGLPGGISKPLSNKQVEVRFASSGNNTADHILLNMIRTLKNPAEWIVVTSDNEVSSAATSRRFKVLTAQAFIALMTPHVPDKKEDNPTISPAEVDYWLKLFNNKKD